VALKVWLKDGHTIDVVRRSAETFSSATGIAVELQVVPEGEAHDWLVSGRERPDVVTVPYWYLDELIHRDALRPVDDLVADDRWSRFAPAVVGALSRGGRRWAVPHTLTGGLLSYRLDLLERHGQEPPRTSSDVLALARVLASRDGSVHGLVARASREFSSFETYSGWAWGHGHQLLPESGDPDPDVVQLVCADLISALRETGPADLTARDYAAVGELMQQGRAALLLDTSAWGFFLDDAARSRVAGRIGYAVLQGPVAPVQFLYAEGLGVTTWCSRPAEAAAFLDWRHCDDVVRLEVQEVGRLDLPRVDLEDVDWYRAEVDRRHLAGYMAAVRRSWEAADPAHAPARADFVERARDVMQAVAAVVEGRAPDVRTAWGTLAPREAPGR
jgi:multiple sugar transport system substrate-binding protein